MQKPSKVCHSGAHKVLVEMGEEGSMPALVFRMYKDGGILRSKMAIPVENEAEYKAAYANLLHIFNHMDQELVDAAVENMLEMEPQVMDGSRHAFLVSTNNE